MVNTLGGSAVMMKSWDNGYWDNNERFIASTNLSKPQGIKNNLES